MTTPRQPSPLDPPPQPHPTVWERKQYLGSFPFVRWLDEPWVGHCEGMTASSNRKKKCRLSAIFEYQPLGREEWIKYCWEHTYIRGIQGSREDMDRFEKWVDKNPPNWR